MSDNLQETEQHGSGDDTHHLLRESHAMRSVVRNMVVNMESVLNDLQGIMGDIQSLVVQIDTVTDKINQRCATQENVSNSSSPTTSEHFVRKPQFVHGQNSSPRAVHNALYSLVDSQNFPATSEDKMAQSSNAPIHNVLQIEALRKDHAAEASIIKQQRQAKSRSSETHVSAGEKREIRLPSSSKSFGQFSKDGINSPSGGIAIVYPTIKNNPAVHSNVPDHNTSITEKLEGCADKAAFTHTYEASVYMQRSSPATRNNITSASRQILPSSPFRVSETKDGIRQKYSITSVYNKYFQPVTPTEQRSPVIPAARRIPPTPGFKNDHSRSSVSAKLVAQDSKPYRVSYPIPDRSTLSSNHSHKYCTIGSSLSNSLQAHRDPLSHSQRLLPGSPLLKRSVYGSPVSNRSPISVRRLGNENYYFSIESDLDSDALIENIDNRSVTPDIDWSYLNLVGNDHFQGRRTRIPDTPISDHAYEIPVVSARVVQPFQMIQTSPDVISRLPLLNVHALPKTDCFIRYDSSFMFQGPSVLDKIYNSPQLAHVFCSEVVSFQTSGYCGCYESVLDSVLENLPGFESFEEACEDLDNNEAINETYVSFDDEFEEDDWDIGMKSDDQDEYELPSFNMQALCDYEYSLFEKLEPIDDNKNIFTAAGDTAISQDKLFSTGIDKRKCYNLNSSQGGLNDIVNERTSKRRPSPVFTDAEMYDDLEFPRATGNSFSDEDCCAIKPRVTNLHENFILCHKSFIPNELPLFSEGSSSRVTECDTEMSSSDDTSCQAIGTGSPMSFSSPEAALTSPDTDRFVTSSEGDDLLTSQEEAYFHLSETKDNANLSAARANMLQLRREFFESLYTVCEKREKERSQDNELRTVSEETISYDTSFSRVDNSKDNVSEAGSYQEDVASYNKSINTWTTYAIVHMQADDISDSASDIFNDNNVNCSMTSSYLDADNIGTAPGNQGLTC